MTLLILGLALWSLGHVFKRMMPKARGRLDQMVGVGPAKGFMALVFVAAIVFMVLGYRGAPVQTLYTPLPGIGHLTVLLMLVALFMTGMGQSKGISRSWLRHPMLLSVILWAGAHLLVNGDLASVILFGGMGLWAILHIQIMNKVSGPWVRKEAGALAGDIKGLIIVGILFVVITGIHILLGVNPFLGTYS